MEARNQESADTQTFAHRAARPMKVVADPYGATWLCDREVDERRSLEEQGCWRCGDLAFTRDD